MARFAKRPSRSLPFSLRCGERVRAPGSVSFRTQRMIGRRANRRNETRNVPNAVNDERRVWRDVDVFL